MERTLSDDFVCDTRVRVRYAETDRMGVVYHANYLVWFEVGRVEWLRQMGFSYREMEENDDCAIAVVDVHCRYKAPALYDEELIVRTHLKNVRECMVHFIYEVLRASDNTLLAEGDTTHLVIGKDMKVKAIPPKYMAAFRKAIGR
jgi:acyl-CoA thioester hydrolase